VFSYILRVRLKMIDEPDKIVFIGSLPPIQSAILIDGMGDGAKIKIDIPRQYIYEVLKLHALAGKLFKVTIELEESNGTARNETETDGT